MRIFLKPILDFLLPPICPVTGEGVDAPGLLSPKAWQGLEFIEKPWCPSCGQPMAFAALDGMPDMQCAVCLTDPPPFDSARSVWRYNDMSRALILRFKHGDQLQLARSFAPHLTRAMNDLPAHPSICIPVPLHRFRLLRRLYNQAAILCQWICRENRQIAYAPHVLLRMKATKSQGHMTAPARHKNVKNAFHVPDSKQELVKGKHVLLVDDVYTSGATVKACAKTLKDAGAARVDVLTLIRAVRES